MALHKSGDESNTPGGPNTANLPRGSGRGKGAGPVRQMTRERKHTPPGMAKPRKSAKKLKK